MNRCRASRVNLRRQFPNVDVRQLRLSNEDGQGTFVHVLDPDLEGYSGLTGGWVRRDVATNSVMVTTERLDDHLPSGWLPDFVKIDVEGAERLVLEGAPAHLRTAKPTSLLNMVGMAAQDSERSESIYKLICQDVGLRLFDMDGKGPLEMFRNSLLKGSEPDGTGSPTNRSNSSEC